MDRTHLDAALRYAQLGYPVFPCLPGKKEPATEHGCLDATTDVEQIGRWWQADPQYNVAIATQNLLTVDVDPPGKAWLETVESSDLMAGAVTRTPRGGTHFWFRQNGMELHNTVGKLAVGVDTRANGGYVLVPPSVVDGQRYEWVIELEETLPVAPGWLVELLSARTPPIRESVGEVIEPGARNQAMFRFACFYRRSGMTEEEILASLRIMNQTRCKPTLPDHEIEGIAQRAAAYEPDFVEEAVIMSHFAEDAHVKEEPAAVFPSECLLHMPRVMREAFDYVMATAIMPQPELTLGALIALFGAAFGRKVTDDYKSRTNVMVLALAPSGAGKEHPRQCNKEFLLQSGLELINGPERVGSSAGIISVVAAHPIRLLQLDEIGRLLATMRDPKVSHLYNIGTVLMALYSSSNTVWNGDAYADLTRIKQIKYPHVCVYGTSVPESLYSGLSSQNLTDGLVGRLLVFQADKLPVRHKPEPAVVPESVLEVLRSWVNLTPPGWGNLDSGPPVMAIKSPEAEARHEHYSTIVSSRHQDEDEISSAVWSRAPEKVGKLALIHACCSTPVGRTPVITLEAENWAIQLANYSTRLVLQAARNSVCSSHYESNLKFVFNAITPGITQNQLCRKTQRLKHRERMEILVDLQTSGAIAAWDEKTDGRPLYRYKKLRRVL